MGDVCSRLAWFLSDNSGIESANEIHVRRREIIIINQCTEIYSRRNSTRRAVTLLITAKPNVQYDLLHRCVTPQLSLLLFCFVPFHYDMMTWNLLRHSFSLKGLVQSSKKSERKKKSLQRYRAKCIKRQLYGKYYKMFASKNDRSKWPTRREFDRSSPQSGRTLSVYRPLFWAL